MDAQHDLLSALERWVERGEAPSKIIATKYAGDNRADPRATAAAVSVPGGGGLPGLGQHRRCEQLPVP